MFKTHIPKLLLILLISGLILSAYSLSGRHKQGADFPDLAIPSLGLPPKEYVPPLRLQIPSISIDAPVEQVGVTSAGAMDVPQFIESVAWFSLGTVPGEIGSSVMSGHYGWKDNRASAFDNLRGIRVGALIYVTDADGLTSIFKVRTIKTYAWNADAKEIFTSTDGKAHLNLITCAGVWDVKNNTYLKRLVVFADKVE